MRISACNFLRRKTQAAMPTAKAPDPSAVSTPVPERDGWVQQPTEHPMGTETADRPDRLSPTGYLDPRSSEGRLEASSVKVPRRTAWSVVFIFAGGTYLLGESVDAQLVAIWHQRATDEPPIESWDRGSVGRGKAAVTVSQVEPDGQALEAPLVCTWLTQPSRKPLPGQHHRTGDGNSSRSEERRVGK